MSEHYITPQTLKQLIEDARRTGAPSAQLTTAIQRIARGRVSRHRVRDVEDYLQEAVCHVLANLHKIDVAKNPFSYITSLCWHKLLVMIRDETKEREGRYQMYDTFRSNKTLRTGPGCTDDE